ncbi:TolB family protein [Embleya sp. AB8]|uniref:TolB family protein n=1 Tax=Embleya sp. AB8 TaxID=3156304 RepID=UPI003C725789
MAIHPPWELALDTVRERPVRRARLLLVVGHARGRSTVVLDADSGEFVGIPGAPAGAATETLSLSPDGTQVVFRTKARFRSTRKLVVHTLATGAQRSFDAQADGTHESAALSPDGYSLATIGDLGDDTFVDVTDLRTGTRRRLWSGAGMASMDGALGWSFDGRLLAGSYTTLDGDGASIVLDARDGRVVRRYEAMSILPGPNGAWLGEHELVLTPDEFEEEIAPILVADVAEGDCRRHEGRRAWHGLWAAIDGRLVHVEGGEPAVDGVRMYTTDLDGTDPRPFLTIAPGAGFTLFDHAPRSGSWSY